MDIKTKLKKEEAKISELMDRIDDDEQELDKLEKEVHREFGKLEDDIHRIEKKIDNIL